MVPDSQSTPRSDDLLYLEYADNVSARAVDELRAPPWKDELVSLDVHPVLLLLVLRQARVGHVAEPHLHVAVWESRREQA